MRRALRLCPQSACALLTTSLAQSRPHDSAASALRDATMAEVFPNIPTALTAAEARLLRRLARDRVVIEAGSLLGFSTITMARTARRVIAVDPHNGYPRHAPRPTLHAFRENVRRHGVDSRVHVVVDRFERAFPRYSADLAFLDLTGQRQLTEDGLRHALAIAPLVAVHDYERGGCHGCTEAVDYLVRSGGVRVVARADTLVVLARVNPPKNSWTPQNRDQAVSFQLEIVAWPGSATRLSAWRVYCPLGALAGNFVTTTGAAPWI